MPWLGVQLYHSLLWCCLVPSACLYIPPKFPLIGIDLDRGLDHNLSTNYFIHHYHQKCSEMDIRYKCKGFERLVRKVGHLHSGRVSFDPTTEVDDIGTREVFGRICNTEGSSPPLSLSESLGRQIVFVFGSDSIDSIILRHNTYECLQNLGFDHEYIHYEV